MIERHKLYRILKVDLSETLNIASSGSKTYTFDSAGTNGDLSENEVYQILALRIKFPAVSGATSGTHSLLSKIPNTDIAILYGDNAYNANLDFNYNHWNTVNSAAPGNSDMGLRQLYTIIFTSDYPFSFTYYNSTDATTTEDAVIEAILKVFLYTSYDAYIVNAGQGLVSGEVYL